MVRANGGEGVVPANLDPMDTLSVGADKAPMGVDRGGLPLVFSVRFLLRFNVRGSTEIWLDPGSVTRPITYATVAFP
jgi:hypothetical protein